MNKAASDKRLPGLISGAILALLYIISALLPLENLWGFNHLKYMPVYIIPVYAVLFALILIPEKARSIYNRIKRIIDSFNRLPSGFRLFLILLISAAVLYIFRVHVHSLGDGYQRIYQVEKGYLYYHSEPLDFFLHALFYRLLGFVGIDSGETTYTLFSILAGTAFIASVYRFKWPQKLNPEIGPTVKFLFICMGGVQLFFGYVESYSLYYIFSLLYILFAVRFIATGKKLLAVAILLALACASHLTALLFVPSFIYLIYYNFKNYKPGDFVQKFLPGIIVLIPVAGLIIQEFHLRAALEEYIPTVSGGLLPFFAAGEYSMLSPDHLYDILNELLLIAPIGLILLIVTIFIRRRANIKNSPGIFLGITALFSLLMLLVIDPKLGLARDWDLFSIPAAAIGGAIIIFALLRIKFAENAGPTKLTINALALLFLSGWIFTNSSVSGQLDRTENLLSLSEKGQGYGYELLVYYYRFEAKNNEKALELLNKISGEAKNARVYNKIAKTELDLGREDDALKSIYRGLEIDSNFTELHLMAGTIWTNRGRPDYGLPHFLKALSIEPQRKATYHNIGTAYYKLDSLAMALRVYKDVIDLYPDDAMAYVEAGNMFRLLRQYDSANFYIREGLQIDPGIAEGYQLLNMIKRETSP